MEPQSKLGAMVAILLASLFAVSFPTISKQLPFHIPPILFFIGKHFGTGVILATAFLHLLDDAFRSLQSPIVEKKYGKIGNWTGFIILVSLLAIFLVEYVSTSYVEHLRNRPSAPSTPVTSPSPSPITSCLLVEQSLSKKPTSENTPLLPSTQANRASSNLPIPSNGVLRSQSCPHPHPHPHHYSSAPCAYPRPPSVISVVDFIEVLTNSPRICRLGLAGEHQHHHHDHGHEDGLITRPVSRCHSLENGEYERGEAEEELGPHSHILERSQPTIGRKRQIISILVLQLGIMIHSLVIGLTLAVATGSDFTSLTTAIIFHQLFEGLSLGIRIAALPPANRKENVLPDLHDDHGYASTSEGMSHPSERTLSESRHSSMKALAKTSYNQHNGAVRYLKSWSSIVQKWRGRDVHWLKPTLSFLFAVTTPFGMTLGMLVFGSSQERDVASVLFIQGVMSAISAGMLVYAATVEMIAGDFVFGDVEGGHHHHHHHHHEDEIENSHEPGVHPHDETGGPKRGRRREVVGVEEEDDHSPRVLLEGKGGHTNNSTMGGHNQASLAKRVLAVVSLFMGVGMMVVAAQGE